VGDLGLYMSVAGVVCELENVFFSLDVLVVRCQF
jgi:hypothetical protein